jgi:hypothetical protein
MTEPAKSAVFKEIRKLNINDIQQVNFVSNSIKTARYNM